MDEKIGLGLKKRTDVLTNALMVENMTSVFLAGLLGIQDRLNSRILGNKGGSLSFNQKVDMLIEMGALSGSDRNKFQAFMEIRNQFMHNIDAKDYETCLSYTSGTDKFLLKTYPQKSDLPREEQLQAATTELGNEVLKLTSKIIDAIKVKAHMEAEADLAKLSQKAFIKAIEDVAEAFDKLIEVEIEKGTKLSAKRFKGLGDALSKNIYRKWKHHFNELVNSDKLDKNT